MAYTLIASPLNPIQIFSEIVDPVIFWSPTNINSLYRHDYAKPTHVNESLEVVVYWIPTDAFRTMYLKVFDCATHLQLGALVPAVSLGGGYYKFNFTPQAVAGGAKYYVTIDTDDPLDIPFPMPVATTTEPFTYIKPLGVSLRMPDFPYEPTTFTIGINTTVQGGTLTIYFFRCFEDGTLDTSVLLGQGGGAAPAVGNVDFTIPVPGAVRDAGWGKGDWMGVLVQHSLGAGDGGTSIRIAPGSPNSYRYNIFVGQDSTPGYTKILRSAYTSVRAEYSGRKVMTSELLVSKLDGDRYISNSNTLYITYSTPKLFAYWPANQVGLLPLQFDFWKESFPEEFEDIEIVPGEFVKLRGEVVSERMLRTGYMPNYMHRKLKYIFACLSLSIEGVEYLQRAGYTFENIKHYALSQGQVTLTERKSIVRNIK